MKSVQKACPCLLRRSEDGSWTILVFKHPCGDWQLAKGTVDPGENPDTAAFRELEEESGLTDVRMLGKIAVHSRYRGAGPDETGPLEHHPWHIYHLEEQPGFRAPDSWSHQATGSPEEEDLTFRFFWMDLHASLDKFHDHWQDVFNVIRTYVAKLDERK